MFADYLLDVVWQDLVRKAVSLAIARDGASGGVVRTVIVRYLTSDFCFLNHSRFYVGGWGVGQGNEEEA